MGSTPGVRLVAECRGDHASEWEAMRSVAHKFGIGTTETVPIVFLGGRWPFRPRRCIGADAVPRRRPSRGSTASTVILRKPVKRAYGRTCT